MAGRSAIFLAPRRLRAPLPDGLQRRPRPLLADRGSIAKNGKRIESCAIIPQSQDMIRPVLTALNTREE
jgi:hypothetical protein